MANTGIAMEITGRAGRYPSEIDDFIKEWYSNSPFIRAHTSGSTGRPKPVRLLKSDALESARMTCRFLNLPPGGVMALVLSPDYIAGKMMIVRSLETDSLLWAEAPSNHPLAYYELEREIDLLAVVPSQLPYLIESQNLTYVRNLIIGGSALPESYEQRLLEKDVNAYVTYGMTETCSHVALRAIGDDFYQALPSVCFDIDERGCLIIDCKHLSVGTIITNDIVELRDCHSFRWLGRFDNVVNSGGIKIFPEEMEKQLSRIGDDLIYYLCGRSSERWGEELVMVVEGRENLNDLYKTICACLPSKLRPKAIYSVKKISRTSSGKIKRIPISTLTNVVDIFEPNPR